MREIVIEGGGEESEVEVRCGRVRGALGILGGDREEACAD